MFKHLTLPRIVKDFGELMGWDAMPPATNELKLTTVALSLLGSGCLTHSKLGLLPSDGVVGTAVYWKSISTCAEAPRHTPGILDITPLCLPMTSGDSLDFPSPKLPLAFESIDVNNALDIPRAAPIELMLRRRLSFVPLSRELNSADLKFSRWATLKTEFAQSHFERPYRRKRGVNCLSLFDSADWFELYAHVDRGNGNTRSSQNIKVLCVLVSLVKFELIKRIAAAGLLLLMVNNFSLWTNRSFCGSKSLQAAIINQPQIVFLYMIPRAWNQNVQFATL